jgi:hypothetical protein
VTRLPETPGSLDYLASCRLNKIQQLNHLNKTLEIRGMCARFWLGDHLASGGLCHSKGLGLGVSGLRVECSMPVGPLRASG